MGFVVLSATNWVGKSVNLHLPAPPGVIVAQKKLQVARKLHLARRASLQVAYQPFLICPKALDFKSKQDPLAALFFADRGFIRYSVGLP